jgi:hypothetical protein
MALLSYLLGRTNIILSVRNEKVAQLLHMHISTKRCILAAGKTRPICYSRGLESGTPFNPILGLGLS